jgi:hypothetical protein
VAELEKFANLSCPGNLSVPLTAEATKLSDPLAAETQNNNDPLAVEEGIHSEQDEDQKKVRKYSAGFQK